MSEEPTTPTGLPDSTDTETGAVDVDAAPQFYMPSDERRKCAAAAADHLDAAIFEIGKASGKHSEASFRALSNILGQLSSQLRTAAHKDTQWPR